MSAFEVTAKVYKTKWLDYASGYAAFDFCELYSSFSITILSTPCVYRAWTVR